MKDANKICLVLSLLLALNVSYAQGTGSGSGMFPGYSVPDALTILPSPPEPGTPEFAGDRYWYDWGKEQRKDSLRAKQAIFDCQHSNYKKIGECFSDSFGVEISRTNTPMLCQLLKDVYASTSRSFYAVKDSTKRIRPFVQFGEPSVFEEYNLEEHRSKSYSFPSGHTFRAYLAAYILSEINPAAADSIMLRARIYAENRIVCGHHYKSDVDASVVFAATVIATLHANPAFLRELELAKEEFGRKRCQGAGITAATGKSKFLP